MTPYAMLNWCIGMSKITPKPTARLLLRTAKTIAVETKANKYTPANEMRKIATPMLEDEHSDVRRVAFHTLIQVLKDDSEELKRVAVTMQNDEDRLIRKMAGRVLQRFESDL